ncbi:MAG: ESCO1/2 acetyl-transferase-domain-containing protein [Monoraphidium minutum]|nr:MAG: ESCO1/2 acetyl-transferase-domain-containing protein [Monoraphidium minutum]
MKQGRLEAFYGKQRAAKAPQVEAVAPQAGVAGGGAGGAPGGSAIAHGQLDPRDGPAEQQQQRKRKVEPDAEREFKENRQPLGDEVGGGGGKSSGSKPPPQQQQQQQQRPTGAALVAAAALCGSGGGRPAAPTASRLSGGKRSVQVFLDLGQRDFSASRCPACGMVYARGREDDEALHRAHCAPGSQGVKFQGWARERVLLSDAFQGRLLMVLPSDPASHIKKLEEVAALVERLHCLTPGWLLAGEQWKAFLYVSTQRRVVGMLVAEPLRQAFRVAAAPGDAGEADSQPPQPQPEQQAAGEGRAPQQPPQPQPPQRAAIWRGLHGRAPSHAAAGLSGGASSLGSGGTAGRGADSCPPALVRSGQGLGLASPVSAGAAAARAAAPGGAAAAVAAPAAAPAAPVAPAPAAPSGRSLAIDRSRPARAALGVRMVWVSAEQRRKGVASRLLDAARANLVQCYVAPRAQVAFTHPTEAGAALAAAYVGPQQGWLIYGV